MNKNNLKPGMELRREPDSEHSGGEKKQPPLFSGNIFSGLDSLQLSTGLNIKTPTNQCGLQIRRQERSVILRIGDVIISGVRSVTIAGLGSGKTPVNLGIIPDF